MARHDMTISDLVYYIRSRPVNGFVCCLRGSSVAVCNPTTRQIVKLPDVELNGRSVIVRLGYDPVEDQYKVLCVMMFDGYGSEHKDIKQEHFVFTLRSQQQEWRKIDVIGEPYTDVKGGICIDGAIYYGGVGHTRLARFDVRTEKIEFIHTQKDEILNVYCWTLINHQGKIGGLVYDNYLNAMHLWLQEKEECWNFMNCELPCECKDLFRDKRLTSPGETNTGEVMLVYHNLESCKPFSIFCYDPIRESFRILEVEGIADREFRLSHGIGKHARRILCFLGHIENIMFL